MIKIQNLTFSFSDHKVLDNFQLIFLQNQVYGIVGLNGAENYFFNVLSTNLKPRPGV